MRTVTLSVASDRATIAPDGWTLLQQTRLQYGVRLSTESGSTTSSSRRRSRATRTSTPTPTSTRTRTSTPTRPGASCRRRSRATPCRVPVAASRSRTSGRSRGGPRSVSPRRPVVAILDTGCGEHDWLPDDVVTRGMQLLGARHRPHRPVSPTPRWAATWLGALDGLIDPLSGSRHLHRRAGAPGLPGCPDPVVASRPSDGPIVESELVTSLAQIAELVRRFHAGEEGGQVIDVLSLSIGYYHETPVDALFDPTIYSILEDLSRHGTQVVCSAGNDATSRPSFPAAFAPWSDGNGPVTPDPDIAADRLGRRAQPQRDHRCALQQRRSVGPGLRAGRVRAEHGAAELPGRPPVRCRHDRLRPSAGLDRRRRLPRRFRGLEWHLVRRAVLAGRTLLPT